MKYSILLCLLLVLVNSKIEPKSFFTKVIKHYIEDEDYGEEEEEDEYCSYKLDKKQCKSSSAEENEMCCYGSAKIMAEEMTPEFGSCTSMPKIISLFSDLARLPETKVIARETIGYLLYNLNSSEIPDEMKEYLNYKVDLNLQCPNSEFSYNYEPYTHKEKLILSSNIHCLEHISSAIKNERIPMLEDDDKCEDYVLLESSVNAGIECGYLSVFAQIGNDTENNQTISTCMLFNEKVVKNIFETDLIKKLIIEAKKENEKEDEEEPEYIKAKIEDDEKQEEKDDKQEESSKEEKKSEGINISKLIIEFRNAKGQKYSYTYDSSLPDRINNSYLITISKFLFLFILFLF